jgi:hypothetical protein
MAIAAASMLVARALVHYDLPSFGALVDNSATTVAMPTGIVAFAFTDIEGSTDPSSLAGRESQRDRDPWRWVSTSSGTGVVSHPGRVTWTLQHCFQTATGTFTDGELTMTAAKGSQVSGIYGGGPGRTDDLGRHDDHHRWDRPLRPRVGPDRRDRLVRYRHRLHGDQRTLQDRLRRIGSGGGPLTMPHISSEMRSSARRYFTRLANSRSTGRSVDIVSVSNPWTD